MGRTGITSSLGRSLLACCAGGGSPGSHPAFQHSLASNFDVRIARSFWKRILIVYRAFGSLFWRRAIVSCPKVEALRFASFLPLNCPAGSSDSASHWWTQGSKKFRSKHPCSWIQLCGQRLTRGSCNRVSHLFQGCCSRFGAGGSGLCHWVGCSLSDPKEQKAKKLFEVCGSTRHVDFRTFASSAKSWGSVSKCFRGPKLWSERPFKFLSAPRFWKIPFLQSAVGINVLDSEFSTYQLLRARFAIIECCFLQSWWANSFSFARRSVLAAWCSSEENQKISGSEYQQRSSSFHESQASAAFSDWLTVPAQIDHDSRVGFGTLFCHHSLFSLGLTRSHCRPTGLWILRRWVLSDFPLTCCYPWVKKVVHGLKVEFTNLLFLCLSNSLYSLLWDAIRCFLRLLWYKYCLSQSRNTHWNMVRAVWIIRLG